MLVVAIVVPASVGSVWVLLASCCCLLFNFFDEGTRLLLERAARIDSEVEDCLAAGDIRLIDCEWLRRNRNVFDVADDEPNAGHNLAAGEVAEKRDGESGVSAGSVAATAVAAPTTRRRMMRMQDLIRAHPDALLPPERAHSLYKRVRMRRSALERIYVLSYAWRTPLHPDPDGHTLENVLRFLDHAHDAMAAQLTCLGRATTKVAQMETRRCRRNRSCRRQRSSGIFARCPRKVSTRSPDRRRSCTSFGAHLG